MNLGSPSLGILTTTWMTRTMLGPLAVFLGRWGWKDMERINGFKFFRANLNLTQNHELSYERWEFPLKFPSKQSIEGRILEIAYLDIFGGMNIHRQQLFVEKTQHINVYSAWRGISRTLGPSQESTAAFVVVYGEINNRGSTIRTKKWPVCSWLVAICFHIFCEMNLFPSFSSSPSEVVKIITLVISRNLTVCDELDAHLLWGCIS